MDKKVVDIINDYKSSPNRDLEYGLKQLSETYDETKELLVKLTYHLDSLEENYNKLLREYQSRNGK